MHGPGARPPRLLTLTVCVALAACSTPVNQNACQSIVDVGTMAAPVGSLVLNGTVWRTSDPADPHAARIAYNAYTTYRVWHGLGHVPLLIPVVIANFPGDPILATQVGNTAELLPTCDGMPGVTDHYVLIRNAGGQDFEAIFEIQ